MPGRHHKNPRPFTAYGRVASNQDATVGAYTDTVVATVSFERRDDTCAVPTLRAGLGRSRHVHFARGDDGGRHHQRR